MKGRTGKIPAVGIVLCIVVVSLSHAQSSPYAGPPDAALTGPRDRTVPRAGGNLAPGNYTRMRFTTPVTLSSRTGSYVFRDCEFTLGFTPVFGGASVSRTVLLEHSLVRTGLYFEDGGQKGWTIRWSYLAGDGQALRPKGLTLYDNATPTPFSVEDSVCEITGKGSPSAHCEAMMGLGGNSMRFVRVRFVTPGPYVDGVTGQTASVAHGGGNTLFEECEFLSARAFHYTVYSIGPGVVFLNCRLSRGISGYLYPPHASGADAPLFKGCTDLETGMPISANAGG